MDFAELFSLKQHFSLKIAAQVTEIWRKLQQLRRGTNKCAWLPTLQRLGCSPDYPNFSTLGASEGKTLCFGYSWGLKSPKQLTSLGYLCSLHNVEIFFMVWRGIDVSHSMAEESFQSQVKHLISHFPHPSSHHVLMPQAAKGLSRVSDYRTEFVWKEDCKISE